MASVKKLKERVKELEEELKREKRKNAEAGTITVRHKISEMSSEVVDSNPYRYLTHCDRVYTYAKHHSSGCVVCGDYLSR